MKITIDTKEDSHDEIRKVIKLLQTMIEHTHNPDIFASSSLSKNESSPEPTPSMFGMFGETPSEKKEPPSIESIPDEAEPDNQPEVQLY